MSSRPSRGAARLAAILDALPDALVLVNANGTVVNANTIALETFEAPGTALVGRGLLDLVPEFDSRLIPGSMRRPDTTDLRGRTKPRRMMARRTDGSEFPVEVTSANLENGQQAYDGHGYASDELLMLVVRDLSGTVDTEAELARSQRQTEMILRAAAEGVVGTDTEGRVVLVNPAVAQILGYRAGELGGQELHPLVLHSRADGEPFPYHESPLADTLRSGRKHRVRGQVLWSKKGDKVPVDLTTAPVRDGDQLVGAVLTFTDRRPYDTLAEQKAEEAERHTEELAAQRERHADELARLQEQYAAELDHSAERHEEELAAEKDRYAALAERGNDRYEALAARHDQLLAVLGDSLGGPLTELRRELSALAADDAGQLWPEANQVLHHLAAGYSRITTLVSNVLGYQRLDAGDEQVAKRTVLLDQVVAAGVDGAVELIGPGRAQFAVHTPPIEADVDPERLATALAHLIADVAGVDATGNAPVGSGGYMDSTIVVAAAQRGNVVRIEVRGPYPGGDPVHEPIVRGIVRAHGGVLQTHEVPGIGGTAFVLEVPVGGGAGAFTGYGDQVQDPADEPAPPAEDTSRAGRRRARRSSVDAFLDSGSGEGEPAREGPGGAPAPDGPPTGRRRARRPEPPQEAPAGSADTGTAGGTGRRRRGGGHDTGEQAALPPAAPAPAGRRARRGQEQGAAEPEETAAQQGSVPRQHRHALPAAAADAAPPAGQEPPGEPVPAAGVGPRAPQLPGAPIPPGGIAAVPPARSAQGAPAAVTTTHGVTHAAPAQPQRPEEPQVVDPRGASAPGGRRARRALAAAPEGAGPRPMFALPPAEADRGQQQGQENGQHATALRAPADDHTPPQPHPVSGSTGRRRARPPQQRPEPQSHPRVPYDPRNGPFEAENGTGDPDAENAEHTENTANAAGAGDFMDGPYGADPADPYEGDPYEDDPYEDRAPGATSPHHEPGRARNAGPGGQGPEGVAPVPQAGGASHGPSHGAGRGEGSGVGRGVVDPRRRPGRDPRRASASEAPEPQAPFALPGPAPGPWPAPPEDTPAAGTAAGPLPMERPTRAGGAPRPRAGGAPQEPPADDDPNSTQSRGFSVRTLGQGVPFGRPTGTPPHPAPGAPRPGRQPRPLGSPEPAQQGGTPPSGVPAPPGRTPPGGQPAARRRKLGTRTEPGEEQQDPRPGQPPRAGGAPRQGGQAPQQHTPPPPLPGSRLASSASEGGGRSYAIGAPDEDADEGPEPLDGPGGAVEVSNQPQPQPMDDELPPEPLDNPRRLLVWPAPDVNTQQALSDRGYRPVIVHSREEVDAQIAAFPAALFVDPLTGPITRTALQSLRQAAVAAEVPVLVTAGLGQATRDAAYGADPAVLLKALAPRDSEQHPPRVLLIEEHPEIALALTASLERRGMQVARAATDADAVTLAGQMRPNLVVMDLMQVRRRRAGIVDWLRAGGQLNRTPLVVYTAAVDQSELPRLAAGETVLFLAERSTSTEVQGRIVDLLAKIGTN